MKMIKTTSLVFFAIILPYLVISQNWVTTSVSGNMNKIDFNLQTGVVVGNNGVILKTIDGGLTYTTKNSGVSDNLVDVKYIGNNTFLACGWTWGSHGVLLKSTDNGDTWNIVLSLNGQYQELFGIFSLSSDSIYISGTNQIIKTFDGFANYSITNFINGYQVRAKYFNNQIITMAHAGTIVFRKSSDFGSTYQNCVQQPNSTSWRDMIIYNNGLYAIGYGKFCKSNDGDEWDMITIPNIDYKSLNSINNILYTCTNNDLYEIDTLGNATSIFTSSNTINSAGNSDNRLFAVGNNFIAYKDLCTLNNSNQSHEACGSYTWNGTTYIQSGQYSFQTTSANGCDSTATLNLTIHQPTTSSTSYTACGNYSWNGNNYIQSGQYTFLTTNAQGCDSTATLNLTINQPTSATQNQSAIDNYTWPVNGQTYTQSGIYTAVIPNAAGCDSTITLNLSMSFTGLDDVNVKSFQVFPNPTSDDLTILLPDIKVENEFQLLDASGRIVTKGKLYEKVTSISLKGFESGTYLLTVGMDSMPIRIVKE
jgi:hypothetical protein